MSHLNYDKISYGYKYKNLENFTIQSLTNMAECNIALIENLYTKEKSVMVMKDTDGFKYIPTPKKIITIFCEMLGISIFGNNSLKMFRIELEELIKKTIRKQIGEKYDPF